MKRTLLLVSFGVICGFTAAYLMLGESVASRQFFEGGWVTLPAQDHAAGVKIERRATPESGGFSRRAAVYEVAAQADPAALGRLLDKLAAEPDSPGRRFSAQVLLSRYLDFDPDTALEQARRFGLAGPALAGLYAQWAEADPEAALAAFQFEQNLAALQNIGDALIEVLGGNLQAILRVINALPLDVDRDGFQARSIGVLGRRSPDEAWAMTEKIDDIQLRLRAQQRIVEVMVDQDPQAAVARALAISDRVGRNIASRTALQQWARVDPVAALNYLTNLGDELPMDWVNITMPVYSEIALAEPIMLLESVDLLPAQLRDYARIHAVSRWAKLDPAAALAYVDSLPPGREGQQLLQTAAKAYARNEPEAALAWVRSLEPRPRHLLASMLESISVKDPARALSLAAELDTEQERMEAMQAITVHLATNGQGELVARQILGMEDSQARTNTLGNLASIWGSQDPAAALLWFTENQAEVGAQPMRQFTARFTREHPRQAAQMTERIPEELRNHWINSVAAGFAMQDPTAALEWIDQFRGQPGYDAAAAQVLMHSGADRVQDMMDLVNYSSDSNLVNQVAARAAEILTRQSPGRAAAWAEDIADERTRSAAFATVAREWAASDPAAAQRWVLDLPSGASRDAAITSVITSRGQGIPGDAVLAAYSSDIARQNGIIQSVYRIAREDPAGARRLVDKYITDPTLRARAEQTIESFYSGTDHG